MNAMSQPASRVSPKTAPVPPAPRTGSRASLWDKLDALGKAQPPARWRAIPADLAQNVKHYLDGQPKR